MSFNKRGFYPDHDCKVCGNPLGGKKHGPDTYDRPAELYAGTYTGICYTCQNRGPYVEYVLFDGLQRVSYPPHCPSWRRDRESYDAYPDCPDCGGRGRFYVSRSFPRGGPYYRFCRTCSDRRGSHPIRTQDQAYWDRRLTVIRSLLDAKFQAYVESVGGLNDSTRIQIANKQKQLLAHYDHLRDKFHQIRRALFPELFEMTEPDDRALYVVNPRTGDRDKYGHKPGFGYISKPMNEYKQAE